MEIEKLAPILGQVLLVLLGLFTAKSRGSGSVNGGTGPLEEPITPNLVREILRQHREDILTLRQELAEITKLQAKVHALELTRQGQGGLIEQLENTRDGLLKQIADKDLLIAAKDSRIKELEIENAALRGQHAV